MDAAGKDGAVRAVLSCLSPQGVLEHSFKVPSSEETTQDIPECPKDNPEA